jgi:intermediate peptidase
VEGTIEAFLDSQDRSEGGMMRATETYSQLQLAVLDQHFHSEIVANPGFDSTVEYQRIVREYEPAPSALIAPEEGGDRWHARFGHLYGYGASYYSYLFDRVIAQKIWSHLFSSSVTSNQAARGAPQEQLDRRNGELLKHSLLKFGGARDPWISLAEILDLDQIAHGGFKAVDVVGKWGLWK